MTKDFRVEIFKEEHLDQITLRAWEQENVPKEEILGMAQMSEMYCLFIEGEAIAIVGYMRKWADVYEVFVFPAATIKYPVFYVKRIRAYLDTMSRTINIRRMQTISLADKKTNQWMRALGFVLEGTLVGYTEHGVDCNMWARHRR